MRCEIKQCLAPLAGFLHRTGRQNLVERGADLLVIGIDIECDDALTRRTRENSDAGIALIPAQHVRTRGAGFYKSLLPVRQLDPLAIAKTAGPLGSRDNRNHGVAALD